MRSRGSWARPLVSRVHCFGGYNRDAHRLPVRLALCVLPLLPLRGLQQRGQNLTQPAATPLLVSACVLAPPTLSLLPSAVAKGGEMTPGRGLGEEGSAPLDLWWRWEGGEGEGLVGEGSCAELSMRWLLG